MCVIYGNLIPLIINFILAPDRYRIISFTEKCNLVQKLLCISAYFSLLAVSSYSAQLCSNVLEVRIGETWISRKGVWEVKPPRS